MKKIFKLIGVIAIIAVIGFSFSACGDDSGDNDNDGDGGGDSVAISIEMVSIPAGTFMMGSPASEPDRGSNETQHTVILSGFSMSKYLVTQAQWKAITGKTIEQLEREFNSPFSSPLGDHGRGPNHPVFIVSWYDVIVFCNKLSIKEGLNPVYSIGGKTNPADWGVVPFYDMEKHEIIGDSAAWDAVVMDKSKNGYRLPTEAEWEYACRGDYPNKATETNTKPFGIGDGTKIVSGMASFDDRSPYDLARGGEYEDENAERNKTTEVGSYTANNYGLYDMHGNVWEWCWDWYGSYSGGSQTDPTGAVSGSNRVIRGGSWASNGHYLRSASRLSYTPYHPGFRYYDTGGFRLVRSCVLPTAETK
jgi:formylglycine-generating enzyme required for sulfatase activity